VWGAWVGRLVCVSSGEVLVVSERVACAKCGDEYHRAELSETADGKLCEVCLQDFLDEEAEGWGVSVSQGVKYIGGFVVVVAVLWAAFIGPRTFFDVAVDSVERCLNESSAGVSESPEDCLAELEETGWLGYFPQVTDYDSKVGELHLEAYGAQLYDESVVEPSVEGRDEAMEKLVGVEGAQIPVRHVLEGAPPANYLWTVDGAVDSRRTSLAVGMYDGMESMSDLEDAHELAVGTQDEQLLGMVFDKLGEVSFADCPVRCGQVLEIAASMCLAGERVAGEQLAKEFGEFFEERTVEQAYLGTWGEMAGDVQEQFRENFEKTKERVGRRAKLLREACGDGAEEVDGEGGSSYRWWESKVALEVVSSRTPRYAGRSTLGVLAERVVGEKITLEKLRTILGHTYQGSTDFSEEFESVVGFVIELIERRKLVNTPEEVLRATPTASAGTFYDAADRIANGDGARDDVQNGGESESSPEWQVKLRQAFLLEGAVAAAHVGDCEKAFGMLDGAEASGVERLREFRASLHRLFGESERAMEVLAAGSEPMTPDPFVQWLGAAGAAGAYEKAVSRLEALSKAQRNEILKSVHEEAFVGLTYAVAYYSNGEFEETVRGILPESYHPETVNVATGEEYATGRFARIYQMVSMESSERKEHRRDLGVSNMGAPVWYLASLARSVGPSYDAEVWVDYLTGGETIGEPEAAWRRAEVARWRGDEEAEQKWMDRVFVAGERRDSATDVLLGMMR